MTLGGQRRQRVVPPGFVQPLVEVVDQLGQVREGIAGERVEIEVDRGAYQVVRRSAAVDDHRVSGAEDPVHQVDAAVVSVRRYLAVVAERVWQSLKRERRRGET